MFADVYSMEQESTESYTHFCHYPSPNAAPDAATMFYILLATCECIHLTALSLYKD